MCMHGSYYALLQKLNMINDDTHIQRSDRFSKIREKISKNLDLAHERADKVYNLRSRTKAFQKGQIVFHRNHAQSSIQKGINSKFLPKFIKCRVREKIGNCLYDIENLGGKLIGRFHGSDLRN